MTTVARADFKSLKPLSDALNFHAEEVVFRFQEETSASTADASFIFTETKRWLWACAKRIHDENAGVSVPPQLLVSPEITAIDQMWHCFLMFTREYQEFCDRYLGVFIHHVPLTKKEAAEFEALRRENAAQALASRRTQLKPQVEYLYDILGAEVVKDWYLTMPAKFRHLFSAEL